MQTADGLLTAQNPLGQKADNNFNCLANAALEADLVRLGFKYAKVQGHYNGNDEESFLVIDITKDDILSLGKKYNQLAVVWNSETLFVDSV